MSILYLNETIQVEQFKQCSVCASKINAFKTYFKSRKTGGISESTWALQMVESRHSPQTASTLILHQNVIMMHMKCI